jgi:hypothetical protein
MCVKALPNLTIFLHILNVFLLSHPTSVNKEKIQIFILKKDVL